MHGLARAVGIIAVLAAHLPVVVGQLPPFTNGGVAKNFKPTFVGASFQSVLTLSDTVFDLRPTRDLHLYLAFTTKSKLPTALRYSTYTGADVVHGKERRGERKYIQEIECYCQLHANSMTWPKVYAYPLSEGYDQEERDPLNKVSLKNGTGLDAYQKDWNLCWKWSKANATAANPNAQVASSFEVGFGSLPDGYYNHILACRHYTMEPKWDWAGASQVLLKVDSKEPVANITASEYKTGLPWKDNDYHNLPYDTRLEDMIPSDHPVYGSDTLAQRMFKHGVLGFHYAIADRMESQLTRTGALVVPIHGCDSTNCATVQMGSNYTGLSINEFDNSPVTCTGNPTCSLNTPQGAQNKFTMEYTDSRVKGATLAKRFFSDYTYDPGATGMYPAQTTGDWSNIFDAAYATPNVKVADNKISFLNIMFPYVSGAPNSAPMRHPAMPDSYVNIPDAQQHLEVKLTDLAGNSFTFVYPIYIADHTRGANKRTASRPGSANPTGCTFKFKLETPPPPANATIATFPPLAFKAFTATGTTVNAGGVNPGSGLISSQALSSLSVDGKYRFSVGAWDSSSNKGNYTSIDWNVDTSGPIPQLLRGWDDFNDGNPTTTGSTHTWKFGEDLVYSEYRANSGAWTMVPEAQWVGVAGMSGDTFKLPPMNTTWLPQNLTQYAVNNDPNNPWTRGDRATNNTFEVRGYDALGNPTAAASYGKEVFTIQSLFSMLDCPTCVSVPCDLDDFSSVKLKGIKDKSVPFYVTTYSDSRVFSHPIDSLGSPPAGAPEFYNSWTNMSFPGARFMPCEAGKGCTTLNTTQRFHTFGVDFAGEGLVRVEVHGADNITTSMIDEHGACALLLVDRTPPKLDLSAQGHAGSCKGGDRSHFFGGSIMDASLDVHSLEVKLEKLGEKTAEPFVPGGEVLDGAWSYTTPRIADGKYTLYVTATDSAGNQGEVLSTDFLVDCYAPKTVFTKKPIMFTKNKVNTFHMGCTEEPCAFEYRVDAPYDGEWTEMDGSTFTVEMEKGVHTVEVRAIDAADNRDSTPATYTMTVLDEEWEAQCQARLVEDRSQGYTDPGPTYLHQPIRFKSHTLG